MNTQVGKSTGIALLMAAALLAALFSMGVFSAGSVGAHDPAPDATPPVLAHDHVNALTALLLDKDGTYIEEDGMDDGSQTSPSPILPIADVATTHTGALALPRNAATLVVTVTGGGSGSEWTAATFTATVDGSSVANVEESPADANTGVFTIPMNDAIAKTLVFTADNTPAGNTDQASTYTITLNYAAANTSDTGSGAPPSTWTWMVPMPTLS